MIQVGGEDHFNWITDEMDDVHTSIIVRVAIPVVGVVVVMIIVTMFVLGSTGVNVIVAVNAEVAAKVVVVAE